MGMAIDNGLECFGNLSSRVDVVELAGGDERRRQGANFSSNLMPGEERIFLVRQTGRMAFSTGFVSSSRRPFSRKRVSPYQ